MANPNFRVVIPTSAKPLLDLAEKVYNKHMTDGQESPLRSIRSNNWDAHGSQIAEALSIHNQSEELKRQAEILTKQRDMLIDGIKKAVKSSRDVLIGIYSDNPNELGQWGYEVNTSPSDSKAGEKKA